MRQMGWLGMAALVAIGLAAATPADPPGPEPIDATTLRRKVLCGYQGWFRCPGDPAGQGWRHWSRVGDRIAPETLTFEMWPDMTEAAPDERHPAPGFTTPDGRPAELFGSDNPRTVERHFRWMQQYGIDGVFVQRFLVNLGDPSFDRVLNHVRESAGRTGRVFAVCYDMTGAPADRLADLLRADWKRLIEEVGITRGGRYLHHDGKPVLFVWGFYPDRFAAATAHRIIDAVKSEGPCAVTLIGGVPWYWRQEQDAEWGRAFRRFDVISPWNVGNYTTEGGKRYASTRTWEGDRDEARRAGMEFLPVIYPGFGRTHLMGPKAADQMIPRLGGAFYWRQFARAADLGLDMAYVAMFDEVDEGTAIFKVTNDPPTQARFQTYEGLPPDWYLRLTGEGSKLLRGERAHRGEDLPIRP